ncbi:hypothetical protein HHL16_19245 [Pseudoflavitalea sp. G-6-1-2]|uniref:hypothetical protein n=1 Tax=Pseudoflavitalea sp. G-6-1-2 TaxID=2728841 RepID=UPI00146F7F3E|nr:hypothetical protein [Pseudoflavitalea sp. G-6-1-2]NML23022.1 hypothetical protein [Pseudoflavitalea sp. G-6-1-2]
MKTNRTSLFILAVEILLITTLHLAKNTAADPSPSMVKQNSYKAVRSYSTISLIGLTR